MQSLQLSIPEPCHENWQNMTPADQGRYCNACAKVVVDFSMMTDAEVLNYFSVLKDEKVCGRALPGQLNRAITLPREPKKRLFWYWNYIMLFFMFFSKSNSAKSQTKGEVVALPVKPACTKTVGMMVAIPQVKQDHLISGKISDKEGKPVPFATVIIKGTHLGVSANANGEFAIKSKPGDILTISATGFEPLAVTVGNNKLINVQLKNQPELNVVFGDVVVTARCVKRPQAVVGQLTTIIKAAQPDTAKPNTVAKGLAGKVSGQQINLVNRVCQSDSPRVMMGGVRRIDKDKIPLLVVDDVQLPMSFMSTINPKDIANITVMKSPEANALYGVNAANGVVLVTTKKKKPVSNTKSQKDSVVKTFVGKMTEIVKPLFPSNTIRVYPNPVARGNASIISLNLQQGGTFSIQVTDLTGRVVLQKKVTSAAKSFMDKIETEGSWPAGIYFINVFDEKNKRVGKINFSVQ